MKKVVLSFILMIFVLFSCFGNESLIYIPDNDEVVFFFQTINFLQAWENGETELTDEKFAEVYTNHVGTGYFSSLLFEQFFRNTKNENIKNQIKNHIIKNNLTDSYAKTLLKKFDSVATQKVSNNKVVTQFSYNDEEFDENINLYQVYEVRPFNDEFGLLLFNNDWNVLSYNNESGELNVDKNVFLLCGGGTNSMSISLFEVENVTSEEELPEAFRLNYFEQKYGDNWVYGEVEQVGVLSNCGVDHYFMGYGTGPDIIPEIYCGDFVAFLYDEELQKVYVMDIMMNFSKINMNYEIRNQIFDYLRFFTFFCFCE